MHPALSDGTLFVFLFGATFQQNNHEIKMQNQTHAPSSLKYHHLLCSEKRAAIFEARASGLLLFSVYLSSLPKGVCGVCVSGHTNRDV